MRLRYNKDFGYRAGDSLCKNDSKDLFRKRLESFYRVSVVAGSIVIVIVPLDISGWLLALVQYSL